LADTANTLTTKPQTKLLQQKLEKQIERLFLAVDNLNKGIKDADEDDAMISKKALNCMSCDKRIVNFQGH